MTKKFGFTLAEVLITLGIIGVVAAMTIPTLIANTNSAKFRSQFKKSLSTLNQAALMGQAQSDMNYGDTSAACTAGKQTADAAGENHKDTADVDPTICAILNDTLSGKTYVVDPSTLKIRKGNSSESYSITAADDSKINTTFAANAYHAYTLADGSMFAFEAGAKACTTDSPCYGFIDVNGSTLPNKEVSCSDGKADTTDCIVPTNNATNMTDIFPVKFYNSTVEPNSDAARYILTTSK